MSQSVCLRRVGTGCWAVGMNRSGERSRTVAGCNSESGLLEVMVERQGCRQASLLHDHERDAVGQGVAFVGSLVQTVPALGEQGFADLHQVYEIARAQPLPDVHGFRVLVAAVEECDCLIEHVTGGHNALHTMYSTFGNACCQCRRALSWCWSLANLSPQVSTESREVPQYMTKAR